MKIFLSFNKIIMIIGVTIFLFLVSVSVFNEKGILRTVDLNGKLSAIERNINVLENENRLLVSAIHSYKSGEFQIEKIAREDLGMAKRNEIIIKFIEENKYQSVL